MKLSRVASACLLAGGALLAIPIGGPQPNAPLGEREWR